jgi:tetratricopeptide (TPR) repeat protein
MLKNVVSLFIVLFSLITVAQNVDSTFKATVDSLKKQDNFSEFIYVQLDEFAQHSTVENLTIFKAISSELWRLPKNENENTAHLYYYINYAYNLKEFGFINQSIIQYEKAFYFYKKVTVKFDIIEFCLKPLANNYTRLGDVDRAEDILKITIEKAQKEKNTVQIIAGYSNLAVAFRTKGEYSKAINYLNLGLNLTTEKQVKSRIYSDLAINYLFIDEVQKAKENIQLSNKLNAQKNNSISIRNYITLGNCFVKKKEFENALIQL